MTGDRDPEQQPESHVPAETATADEGEPPETAGRDEDVAVGPRPEHDAALPDEDDEDHDSSRIRRWAHWLPRRGEDEDSFGGRIALQWAMLRDERRSEPAPIRTGPSNFARAQVPYGLDLAAAWGWRFLVICATAAVVGYAVFQFALVVMPVAIALLITALLVPLVDVMNRVGIPRKLASLTTVVGTVTAVGALITFAGQQVAEGMDDLIDSVAAGLGEIRVWLREGPLNASDSQINDYLNQAQAALRRYTADGDVLGQVTSVGSAVTSVLAGFFIILFATYFFLAEGDRLWGWIVRLSPRAARRRFDSSGRVAWVSLTQFVRATVIVAMIDAVFIAIGAAVLGVPFVLAIGVLVFLGGFVPLVGAFVTGAIAVLVALVDQGPITALLMFAVILVVQQVEGNLLQPFLMGRWVSVHPLAVILAITAGILVAGIAGALVAVPLAAAINAVVLHLAGSQESEEGLESLVASEPTAGETR